LICQHASDFFVPALRELKEIDMENVWFQQDGAIAHTTRVSVQVLREIFFERLISKRGDIP